MEVRIQISWDRSLETGEPDIDEQHRELFRRIDQLLAATRDRRARTEVGRLLTFLGDYVVHHFEAEERIMAEAGYPEAPTHHDEHQRFVAEYARLFQDYRADGAGPVFVIKFGNRVTAWLCEHICRTDRRLVDYLNAHRDGRASGQ
jgi:hemerythrin